MADNPEAGTPLWWLLRLDKQRQERLPTIRRANDYYDGKHNLIFASQQFKKAFGARFKAFADNWCQIVVDATEERLDVVGFRLGEQSGRSRGPRELTPADADRDAWRIWQRNLLDNDSSLAHTEAFISGHSAAIVWGDEDGLATVSVEQADQIVVCEAPGNRRWRRAALKRWDDPEAKKSFATVYLPEAIYKFEAPLDEIASTIEGADITALKWVKREVVDEDWPLFNPLGVVPVIPLENRARINRPGRSEITGVMPLQDAVNKELADMLVASEFGAFRQRWATGWDIPTNPETNQPIFDSVKNSMERFWYSSEETTKFGDFEQTDLANFVKAIEMLVQHIASQTRTPPHYLNPGADRLSGESIKAAETGLVAKSRRKMRVFGESWEEVIRLALKVEDSPLAKAEASETIWRDPEVRNEADHVDAIVKRQALGVPNEQLWEDAGYSPQQIQRFKDMGANPGVEVPPRPDQPPSDQPTA